MRRLAQLAAFAFLALPGCMAEAPSDDCDGPDDPACSASIDALSVPGDYVPDPGSLAAGSALVSYDDVPNWDGGAHCSGGITVGGRALSTYLRANFAGISSIGGYSCRQNTANPLKMSVHGSGRALDIMIPLDHGAADNGVGDAIANWLIANSTEIGIQYIVWDRTQWSGSRSTSRVRPYTGPNPHIDHIHAEITLPASREETPFFGGGSTTPPPPPPPPAVPALDARFVGQGSTAAPDSTGAAQFEICAGAPVELWFELEDTGSASWVDWDDLTPGAYGHAVRLGVPTDTADPLTGMSRVSLNESSNPDVHPASWSPPGGDCNDAALCRRTVFRMRGTAPSAPGIHRTTWRMVDERRAWFGPEMWLSFRVTECAAPPPPVTPPPVAADADGDGATADTDCDDASASVHPGATEVCGDAIDQDCDTIDPACMTPVEPTPDPEIDDPGFEWAPPGTEVYTPHRAGRQLTTGGCSVGRGPGSSATWLVLLCACVLGRRRRSCQRS